MSQAMTSPSEDLIPTRYSLLSRLQNWDDRESWKDFFDTYWRLIYAIAFKAGLSEAEAPGFIRFITGASCRPAIPPKTARNPMLSPKSLPEGSLRQK